MAVFGFEAQMATRLLPLDGQNTTRVRSGPTSLPPLLTKLLETFRGIANKFPDVLPGPGFKITVGSNVLLAFKRIAAQMPRVVSEPTSVLTSWLMILRPLRRSWNFTIGRKIPQDSTTHTLFMTQRR